MKKYKVTYLKTIIEEIEAENLSDACSIAEKKAKKKKDTYVQSVIPLII